VPTDQKPRRSRRDAHDSRPRGHTPRVICPRAIRGRRSLGRRRRLIRHQPGPFVDARRAPSWQMTADGDHAGQQVSDLESFTRTATEWIRYTQVAAPRSPWRRGLYVGWNLVGGRGLARHGKSSAVSRPEPWWPVNRSRSSRARYVPDWGALSATPGHSQSAEPRCRRSGYPQANRGSWLRLPMLIVRVRFSSPAPRHVSQLRWPISHDRC
jgi:hypothetical protein